MVTVNLSLLNLLASVDSAASQTPPNPIPPTVVFTVMALVLAFGLVLTHLIYTYAKRWIAEQFNKSPNSRVTVSTVALALELGALLAVEAIGLSEVRDAGATPMRLFWLCAIVFVAALAGGVSITIARLGDKLRVEFDELKLQNEMLFKEVDKAQHQLKAEQAFRNFAIAVYDSFLKVVSIKREVIVKLFKKKNGQTITLPELSIAFDPPSRIVILVQTMFSTFERWIQKYDGAELRIAYFKREGDYLKVIHCNDRHGNVDCVSSPNDRSRERFRIPDGESLAVKAAISHQILFAEDANACDKEDTHPYLHFDRRTHPNTLRSIVCIPFGPRKGVCEHVISLDTNVAGFFKENLKSRIHLILKNLEQRLLFEWAMDSVLPKEHNKGPANNGSLSPPAPEPHYAISSKQRKASKDI